ncbi:MAG: hypothetical protein ACOH2M_32485 [Cypionkella sp.]
MEILNLRRTRGAGTLVATFDLQATPEIMLRDWQLRDTKKGLRAFPPPDKNGRSPFTVAPTMFSTIGQLAAAMFREGISLNDHQQSA